MTGTERSKAEEAIFHHLKSLNVLWAARRVAAYEATDGEPNLEATLDELHRRGTTLALPLVFGEEMSFRTAIPGGARGIDDLGMSVATEGDDVPVDSLDAVLVPLVAFSKTGQRCGRGRGYYDRTFGPVVSTGTSPALIGIGFEVQRCDELPIRDHDVDLNAMVTEVGVRYFGSSSRTRGSGTRDRTAAT